MVTPAHHYPLGHAMSLENRLALLAWAEAGNAWIVEDDYGGAYRYAGRPLPPLRALDRTGRVIYAGSFSKVLLPALQLSYLVLPQGLAGPVQRALAETGPAPSGLGQGALARFIDEGHLGRHLRRTRKLHAGRQAALLAAARDRAAGLLDVAPLEGGMHLVARPGPDWPPPPRRRRGRRRPGAGRHRGRGALGLPCRPEHRRSRASCSATPPCPSAPSRRR